MTLDTLRSFTDTAVFKYDHHVFLGPIPRTFVGNILLSWVTAPFIRAGIALGVITSKFDLQLACMSSR